MSSFDKVVKLACKPKAAPPKAKYLDPIIAATWSDDGSVHDVCKALAPRIREPNAIVVFKALIVLHTMIRNGATDNVLSYLSSSEVLRLRNVTGANWEGYAAPQNLQAYAIYLESRIRAYKDLKHDAVRVQAESNRDMRNSISIEEEGYRGRRERGAKSSASAPSRSKTIMGRKLRSMAVEKGLLRETKAVHNMIDTLVECRFYLDDLEDELTITALRMLVKDLLILFQAGNEGVINVLEHYFEMSHVDAAEALKIYRHFCKQTEYVVEYLGVAKKLQNLLNVPVPNLRHAPVSLAGSLQEYLSDPNFEQNRIEYKASKGTAEKSTKSSVNGKKENSSPPPKASTSKPPASSPKLAPPSVNNQASTANSGNKDVIDFFSAIEEEQPTMFNPQTNSPGTAYFQQGRANPFSQMPTGQTFAQPAFIAPQQTAMPQQQPNPFGNFLAPQQTGHRPFSSYLPAQSTGFPQLPQQQQQTGFLQHPQQSGPLQPQNTGGNPFRKSMLIPQSTGMALFGVASPNQLQGFNTPNQTLHAVQGGFGASASMGPTTASPLPNPPASALTAPRPSVFGENSGPSNTPARPASTPLTFMNNTAPAFQPVKTHQTGTNNPFGPIATPVPPIPKPPTLFELSSGVGSMNMGQLSQGQPSQEQRQQHELPQQSGAINGFSFNKSALSPGATDMASVASSFAFSKGPSSDAKPSTTFNPTAAPAPLPSVISSSTGSTSAFSDSVFSSLSSHPTGATATTASSVQGLGTLKPQITGFAGLKPFKPSSSFGASLVESLPPIPGSGPSTPALTGVNGGGSSLNTTPGFLSSPLPNSTSNNVRFLGNQRTGATGGFGGTGSTLGVGLRPQMTGGGSANPFRASTAAPGTTPNFGLPAFQPGMNAGTPSTQPFNASFFGTTTFGAPAQQTQQQQNASLI